MRYEDQLYVWCLLLRNKLAGKIAPAHPKDNRALEYAARRLANAEMIPQHDPALMGVNKLARTFAAQVEALKKHRGAGEQPIWFEHVTVNDGGQAVVGIIHPQGGGGGAKIERQPLELDPPQTTSAAHVAVG